MDKKKYSAIDWSRFKADSFGNTSDEISTYFTKEVPDDKRKLYSDAEIICIN